MPQACLWCISTSDNPRAESPTVCRVMDELSTSTARNKTHEKHDALQIVPRATLRNVGLLPEGPKNATPGAWRATVTGS